MKTKMLPALLFRRQALVPMIALLAGVTRSDGAMATGVNGMWRAFALSGEKDSLQMSGSAMIMGDAAVAGADNDDDDNDGGGSTVGSGATRTFSLSGNAMITGKLAYDTRASGKVSGNAVVQGGYQSGFSTNTALNTQAVAAVSQSASYAAMTNSGFVPAPTKIKTSTSLTLSGTNAIGTINVLNLSELTLSGGAVLTINGGLNSQFLINVDSKFSLSGNSSIVLSGGVKADDVVFNYEGTKAVTMSGNTTLNGVVMATNGEFQGSGNAVVKGQVIAGKIKLSGNAKIVSP